MEDEGGDEKSVGEVDLREGVVEASEGVSSGHVYGFVYKKIIGCRARDWLLNTYARYTRYSWEIFTGIQSRYAGRYMRDLHVRCTRVGM